MLHSEIEECSQGNGLACFHLTTWGPKPLIALPLLSVGLTGRESTRFDICLLAYPWWLWMVMIPDIQKKSLCPSLPMGPQNICCISSTPFPKPQINNSHMSLSSLISHELNCVLDLPSRSCIYMLPPSQLRSFMALMLSLCISLKFLTRKSQFIASLGILIWGALCWVGIWILVAEPVCSHLPT